MSTDAARLVGDNEKLRQTNRRLAAELAECRAALALFRNPDHEEILRIQNLHPLQRGAHSILAHLLANPDHCVAYPALDWVLHQNFIHNDPNQDLRDAIQVQICNLRRILRETASEWEIETLWNRGYRIKKAKP